MVRESERQEKCEERLDGGLRHLSFHIHRQQSSLVHHDDARSKSVINTFALKSVGKNDSIILLKYLSHGVSIYNHFN